MKLQLAAAALLASTAIASAADLPARASIKAPPVSPIYNWSGFYVGVQWHPEDTWRTDAKQLALFEALVAAAR